MSESYDPSITSPWSQRIASALEDIETDHPAFPELMGSWRETSVFEDDDTGDLILLYRIALGDFGFWIFYAHSQKEVVAELIRDCVSRCERLAEHDEDVAYELFVALLCTPSYSRWVFDRGYPPSEYLAMIPEACREYVTVWG